ncbi:xylulokinase [Microbacterium sp. RURRCA19A]|uniref:xylulokinase n=1 Tax=Microbacterium sp. RURRCA19A TaxID=1907391 RepID=UPI000953EC3A|nr:xylulokinase [Microbacterium sp. RURRCA19A]SIS16322.1 xylulokinase [Microbacterium sp. RURRCA19A]
MALVMGVDSSTQSCKVVVVDAETGWVVREGRASHPAGTSVDPEAWWSALQDAIAQAGGLDDVAAVSIAGQQHGMVVLDSEGRVIRDALLWNDTRSAQAASDLIAEVGAEAYAERTGVVPVASFTATKLRWLRDAEPDNAARVAAVALPHDWLTWRLRGFGPGNADFAELTTDRSDASGTAYWGVDGYDRELLERALGHDAVLPRVLEPWESAGALAGGALVGPGAGDNAGAALGLGAGVGDVVVSLGTSGTVFAVTDDVVRDTSGAVAGFADATGRFLPLVATLNAARVLDAFAGLLGVSHDELGALALQAEPGADGVVLVPWFEGERTPNLPHAKASLTGLTLASTNRPTLARAAIEGMLSGLAVGLEAIQAQGVEVRRVLLIGGAAANEAVARIAAQVFDAEIVVPAAGEYVALGAARQAAGVLAGGPVDWTVATARTVEPDFRPAIRSRYDEVAALRARE